MAGKKEICKEFLEFLKKYPKTALSSPSEEEMEKLFDEFAQKLSFKKPHLHNHFLKCKPCQLCLIWSGILFKT